MWARTIASLGTAEAATRWPSNLMEQPVSDSPSNDSTTPLVGRVLVVDDEQVVRTFVKRILEHEGHTVTTADSVSSGREAIDGDIDVAVLDVDLPDGDGFELVEALRKQSSSPTPVVMITGNPNDDCIGKSVSQGIIEFLFKPFRAADIRAAVDRGIAAKLRWHSRVDALGDPVAGVRSTLESRRKSFSADEALRLVKTLSERYGLTEREQETLGHLLAGLQNTDIAEALDISAHTVKYHVRNILTKFGMESRTELFRSLLNNRK
jgi:DNA-binding NarL/FixJ family response regulator